MALSSMRRPGRELGTGWYGPLASLLVQVSRRVRVFIRGSVWAAAVVLWVEEDSVVEFAMCLANPNPLSAARAGADSSA